MINKKVDTEYKGITMSRPNLHYTIGGVKEMSGAMRRSFENEGIQKTSKQRFLMIRA